MNRVSGSRSFSSRSASSPPIPGILMSRMTMCGRCSSAHSIALRPLPAWMKRNIPGMDRSTVNSSPSLSKGSSSAIRSLYINFYSPPFLAGILMVIVVP
ncbi:hypothetical protein D3C86_1577070 [compost metagenome]